MTVGYTANGIEEKKEKKGVIHVGPFRHVEHLILLPRLDDLSAGCCVSCNSNELRGGWLLVVSKRQGLAMEDSSIQEPNPTSHGMAFASHPHRIA